MMQKGKIKWVAAISVLVLIIIGAAGYFLYRYYQARHIFEENARMVCGEVEALITEEKFQEASDKISETEKELIDYGRSQLTDVFLSQLQAEEATASAEVTLEKVEQCARIRNLAEALEIDPTTAPELEIFSEDHLIETFPLPRSSTTPSGSSSSDRTRRSRSIGRRFFLRSCRSFPQWRRLAPARPRRW